MLYTIKQFASERGESADTVSKWLRRWLRTHPGQAVMRGDDGKTQLIDDSSEVFAALDTQYPMPVTLAPRDPEVEDLLRQVTSLQQQLLTAKDQMAALQQQLASGEADRLRLEFMTGQLDAEKQARAEAVQRAEAAEARAADVDQRVADATKTAEAASRETINQLTAERDHAVGELRAASDRTVSEAEARKKAEKAAAEARAEADRLKSRGLWARILNR